MTATGIAEALAWGALVGICFPIGAALEHRLKLSHLAIASFMSLGSGLLLAAISIDLAGEAVASIGTASTAAMVVAAAALFSGANLWLSARGARHRKRCGECVAQPSEAERPNSGEAIALGTALDALPEALVLGVLLSSGESALPLAAALGLGNVAQAVSASAGMRAAGRSISFVFGLWTVIAAGVIAATVISFSAFGMAGPPAKPWVEAFAAGILLAMVAEAMLPEAFHRGPRLSGLQAALGFCGFLVLTDLFTS